MDYPGSDPVDHSCITRRHAGESLKDGAIAPGLAGIAVGIVALIVGLFALATGHVSVGFVAVILAAAAGAAGGAWLVHTHRRVRNAELHWETVHSDEPAPPPSS